MSLPVPEPDASTRFLVPRAGRDVAALLSEALQGAGASGTTLRWTRLVEDLPAGDPAAGVVVVDARTDQAPEVEGRALASALSVLTGGFVLGCPLDPSRTGCVVAYAGHLLDPTPTPTPPPTPPLDQSIGPEREASGLLEQITGASLGMLNLRRVDGQGDVAPPRVGRTTHGATGPDRLQVAVVAADVGEVRRVVDRRRPALSGGWRLLGDVTPEAAIPFTMLRRRGGEADLPDDALRDVAGDVGMYAVGLDLPGGTGPAGRWVWAGPDREAATGPADSAAAVVGALSRVAAVLGTYPATLAWPAAEAGEPLDEPG